MALTGELKVSVCFPFTWTVTSAEAGWIDPLPGCVARTMMSPVARGVMTLPATDPLPVSTVNTIGVSPMLEEALIVNGVSTIASPTGAMVTVCGIRSPPPPPPVGGGGGGGGGVVAEVMVNVIVPVPEPAVLLAVTGIPTPLTTAVGVPDITPDELIASP